MEDLTISDWVGLVAQVCTVPLILAMGFFTRSPQELTSKSVRWGLFYCLPFFWEGGPVLFAGLFVFPVIFIMLTHIGYGIHWVLVRTGILASRAQDNNQAVDGPEQSQV